MASRVDRSTTVDVVDDGRTLGPADDGRVVAVVAGDCGRAVVVTVRLEPHI